MVDSLQDHDLQSIPIRDGDRPQVDMKGAGPRETMGIIVADNSELIVQLDRLQEEEVLPATTRMKQSDIPAQVGFSTGGDPWATCN